MVPDGGICDDGKYHWLQAARTGDECYWQWCGRIQAHCWEHFVDHEHGGWFRILPRDHRDHRNTTCDNSIAGKGGLSRHGGVL